MRVLRVGLIACAFTLLLPGCASGKQQVPDATVGRAVQAAKAHWDKLPSTYYFTFAVLKPSDSGQAWIGQGRIDLNIRYWFGYDYHTQCVVIVHEIGHLLGHQHSEGGVMSANPDVMYTPRAAPECYWPKAKKHKRHRRKRHRRKRH